MKEVQTVRWSITSQDLSAGTDKDFIYSIQDQIVDYYNEHITSDTMDTTMVLKDFHARMIKITPSKVVYKGETHVCLEFLNPCDGVSQMYFNLGNDRFKKHDFNYNIPNPITRT